MRNQDEHVGRGEEGFTLIELLVVMVVIGILATIAIPSFLNQKTKANDSSAQELVHNAQTVAETYATDHGGSYAGLSPAVLKQYDATIQTAVGNGSSYVSGVTNATTTGYTITTTPPSGNETFSVTRSNGLTTRTCTPMSGIQGACNNGTW
jgi:type IV pilus assembly protein PilA